MNTEKILLTVAIGLTGFIAWKIFKGQKAITATGASDELSPIEQSKQTMTPYGPYEMGNVFGV